MQKYAEVRSEKEEEERKAKARSDCSTRAN